MNDSRIHHAAPPGHRLPRLGLQGRIIAGCAVLLLGTVSALSFALLRESHRDALRAIREHGAAMARSSSYSAEPYVLLNQADTLQSVLNAAASDKNLVYGQILSADGSPLATYQRHAGFTPESAVEPRRPMQGPLRIDSLSTELTVNQLAVVVPIWSGTGHIQLDMPGQDDEAADSENRLVGYVHLVYSLEHARDKIVEGLWSTSVIAAVVLAAGMVATILLSRMLLKPVGNLVETAQAIAQGDLSRRANECAVDEIAVLARSFNRMADTLREYTENLEAEVAKRTAQLAVSEAKATKLAMVAARTENMVLITDATGRIEWVNDAFERTTEYTSDEVLGRMICSLLGGPDNDSTVLHPIQAEMAAGKGANVELQACTKSGREYWIALDVQPVHDADQAVINFVAVASDITQRREALAAIQRAKEAAEAANRAKSEFLANMSHEIRTPMNGIIGMTRLALETNLNPEQREYLTVVRESADSLLGIINDVLDFSKIEAGKLQLDPAPFRLTDFLADTVKAHALSAHSKGIELLCDIAQGVPEHVIGDAGRLRQIIVNLLSNAIRFTDHGEVVVRVDLESRADHSAELHFRIQDTGVGIPRDKQQSIFESFVQADTSTTRKYGGTGLGLTITSKLVQLMGGRLGVESEQGKGSTFHFTVGFPLAQADALPEPVDARAIDIRGTRTLVVDDNATNRRILRAMTTNWGLDAAEADSGEAALEATKRAIESGRPFKLILLDAMMPGMDGFELAERLAAIPHSSAVLMMLSSADGAGDAARCRQIGIAGYLTKPIKASELLNMTVTLLHGKTVASWKPPPSSANAQRAATPLRILLAEDNLVNQKLTLSLLRKEGHHVRLAENGQEALDRLEEETFDLVLMDVQMPVMDGFEAAGAIRERERKNGGHIPIVAMTANAMRGDQERCLDAGMDEYLAKPIDPDRLRRTLNEWRWKLRRTSPDAPGARLDGVERSDESAGTGSDEAPVNTAQALLRADNDRVRMCEMLSASAQDMARLMTDLRSAAGARDAQAVAASAHKLKKAAAAVSAEPATRLAQQVATLSTSGDLERVESLLNEFQRQVDLLVAFVGSMRDG